jgi:chemotaxis protein histidine kinase CheA
LRLGYFITLLLLCSLAACAPKPLLYRDQAVNRLERVKKGGAATLLPEEFASMQHTFETGDFLLKEKEQEDAERYFYLTLLKAELLEKELREVKSRQEEARLRAEEQKKAELARLAKEEALRLEQARAEAEAEALAQKEAAELARKKTVKPAKERVLVISYTVRRGESLPLIASQPQVYGDRNLWPLIYRANRDQIRDPRHIWPGQVLRIPRNAGREDIAEARRYALERQ